MAQPVTDGDPAGPSSSGRCWRAPDEASDRHDRHGVLPADAGAAGAEGSSELVRLLELVRTIQGIEATVVLVGHGSRDPRSAAALRDLRERVAVTIAAEALVCGVPAPPVELAFLELSEPLLEDVLERCSGEVVIVPLLLTTAFHARDDLPGRVAAVNATREEVSVRISDVLGPHPLLDAAVAGRARDLLADGHDSIVLLGTGSSHESANVEAVEVAERLRIALDVPVRAAFVTRGPDLASAVAQLRPLGGRRPAIVPWFLAPGRLLDVGIGRAAELGVTTVAEMLATDPRLVDLVVIRAARELRPAPVPAPV